MRVLSVELSGMIFVVVLQNISMCVRTPYVREFIHKVTDAGRYEGMTLRKRNAGVAV